MAKRKNLVSFLLDRTGSMTNIWDSTIEGFNEFVQSQLKADYKTVWNVTVFDSESIDLVREGVKGKDMEPLTTTEVWPRGMTPLHDAIAKTIHSTDKLADAYDGVVFVILTDGFENASQEYDLHKVRELIRDREDNKNWQVIFLGANMDAYAVGQGYGILRGQTTTFAPTAQSVGTSYGSVFATATSYMASGQTVSRHTNTTTGVEEEDPRATTPKASK